MNRHVLFRADGGPDIGLGHIRRAEVLASLFQSAGCSTSFAVPTAVHSYLLGRGVAGTDLRTPDQQQPSCDHVLFDINWARNAENAAEQVARMRDRSSAVLTVIDSMPPDHFIAEDGGWPDLLVTPYLHADRFRPAPPSGLWLQGGLYAVLDPIHAQLADQAPHQPPRILVSCGGSDPDGLTARLVDALIPLGHPLDVVVGPLFKPSARVDVATVTYHDSPAGLATLIAGASLVVGRVGLLRYEAASLGRHGIYLHRGEDYRAYLEGFDQSGVAEIFFDEVAFLDRLNAISPADFGLNPQARAAVDGKGAERVVQAVMKLGSGR